MVEVLNPGHPVTVAPTDTFLRTLIKRSLLSMEAVFASSALALFTLQPYPTAGYAQRSLVSWSTDIKRLTRSIKETVTSFAATKLVRRALLTRRFSELFRVILTTLSLCVSPGIKSDTAHVCQT